MTGSAGDRYRSLSYWHDTVPDDLSPRPALSGDLTVDVAIVGGGLTGLWTAYYLARRDPALRIVVLEKEIAGFGASGRNGGWCSALFPASAASLERRYGREAAIRMRQAMVDTVDEVGQVTAREDIACDFLKGGTLSFVHTAAQRTRAEAEVAEARALGIDRLTWSADRRLVLDPACARLHPAKLVRGLANVVEGLGVTLCEGTEVLDYATGRVTTTHGIVTCGTVVLATEGYGATLRKTHRRVLPLYSLMIATEPIPDNTWDEIGLAHGQTFADYRHLLVYGQRTADNRFAFGGRGARYHWGSSIRPEYDRAPRVFEHLRRALVDFFPQAADAEITHRWGGPLGVPRDWHAGVGFDRDLGVAQAGGYVGDGLSTTNLAGRTLADLITGTESELTTLPWVGHRSPDWEPEPLRFVGANLGLLATTVADAEEKLTSRPSVVARAIAPLTGH
ncbi:MAG TPA: FAD-binding oxidoreductase [Homoserinimonas sp.]|nr:FAD-binding oxidoreductase [Homoserinimonas sp.]